MKVTAIHTCFFRKNEPKVPTNSGNCRSRFESCWGYVRIGFRIRVPEGARIYVVPCRYCSGGPVSRRPGQYPRMVKCDEQEQCREYQEGHCPCPGYIPESRFHPPGRHHDPALPDDGRQPVERAAYPHIQRLVRGVKCQHVVSVRRYVVRSRGKSDQPEHRQ